MIWRRAAVFGLLGLLGPAGAAAQSDAGSGLEAGGLTPPGGGVTDPYLPPPTPEQDLAAAEAEDSGRGLEMVWLNAESGVALVGLQTLHADDLIAPELVASDQLGPMFGGGLGVRLVFLTVGARFRFGLFPEWQHWTLGGEVGLHIPLGRLEPYFAIAGGYAKVAAVRGHDVLGADATSIRGWNLRGEGGVDYYLSPAFTLGATVAGDVLFLARPGVDPATLADASLGPDANSISAVYSADGSSIGAGLTATAVVGLHF
jgi:hypothetical protein